MVIYRVWSHTEAVAAAGKLLATSPPRRAELRRLMAEVCSGDPALRKRATDLARLLSARQPGILAPWADVMMDVLGDLSALAGEPETEWQSRGYLALAVAHNVTTPAQRLRLANLLRPMVEDGRNAIRATALEAFARVAAGEPELRAEALLMLEEARLSGTPAMRSRARSMLTLLRPGKSGKSRSPEVAKRVRIRNRSEQD